jgi:hypothetical protein
LILLNINHAAATIAQRDTGVSKARSAGGGKRRNVRHRANYLRSKRGAANGQPGRIPL